MILYFHYTDLTSNPLYWVITITLVKPCWLFKLPLNSMSYFWSAHVISKGIKANIGLGENLVFFVIPKGLITWYFMSAHLISNDSMIKKTRKGFNGDL